MFLINEKVEHGKISTSMSVHPYLISSRISILMKEHRNIHLVQ